MTVHTILMELQDFNGTQRHIDVGLWRGHSKSPELCGHGASINCFLIADGGGKYHSNNKSVYSCMVEDQQINC